MVHRKEKQSTIVVYRLNSHSFLSAVPVKAVIDAAKRALYTGHIGDGKIFVYDVEDVVKVRTGESGFDALQDDK